MMSKGVMGGGAIVVAILIAITEATGLTNSLQYIWALLVLIWGFMSFQ